MSTPKFIRPIVGSMHGYVPGEQPRDRAYVKLNTNENPYPPSPAVLQALAAAMNDDLRLYPDPVATGLRRKAAEVYGVPPEQIIAGNGSDDLLAIVLRACVGEGDRVAYPTPTYTLYDTLVTIESGVPVTVPFPHDFSLPVDELARIDAKVTFVANPNAPSGTWTEVARLDELASRLTGLLVIDEAYVDFGHETSLPLVKKHANVAVLRTFSKSFSLAGMRIGLAFAHESIIAELHKVKDSYNLSRLSLVAGEAALSDYPWMEANAERIRRSRDVLIDGLRATGFTVLPSQANFVLARRQGRTQAPTLARLKDKGILVRYFATPELSDTLRITVGTPSEVNAVLRALRELE